MNRIFLLIFGISFMASGLQAQDFSGQWKGVFFDKSTSFAGWGGDSCDYVLELDVNGTKVSGYSYTYFTDGGRKYYTICSLDGYINKSDKYIEVREVARTKTNVPVHIRNCFQVHKLNYFKHGDTEELEGKWLPAPRQEGDCGFGITSLERRVLKKNDALFNNSSVSRNTRPQKVQEKKPVTAEKRRQPLLAAKAPNDNKGNASLKSSPLKQETVELPVEKSEPREKVTVPETHFEKRNNNIIRTIEVEHVSVKVSLYDNGEIDGDTVSLIYNGKLLLSRQRLSDKPICLNINVDNDDEVNELVMYAENLGSIPPNTALMVVYDGSTRYEVRITSDLKKSGTIRFVLKDHDKK